MSYETIPLGNLATFESGGTPKKSNQSFWKGDIPWISAKTLVGDRVVASDLSITDEGLESGSRIAPSGSILILTRGSGLFKRIPIAIAGRDVAFNQDVKCVQSKREDIDNKYLFYALKAFEPEITAMLETTGIGAGKLSTDRLKALTIPILDSESREKVVSVADALSGKIELNNLLNGYLEELADTLFKQRFGDLTDNAALSDAVDITMGQSPSGSSYNEDGVGTVFYQGRAEFGWRYPSRRFSTTEPKRMAKQNDVLMSVRAPVGDLNLAYEDCCIGRGLAAIHCECPSYGFYLMRSLRSKLDAFNGEGTVFGSINGKTLKSLPIAMPKVEEIKAFEDEASFIDAQIRNNETESRLLAILRDALLPKLMSGEIDVSKVDLTQLNSHLA